MSIRVLIVDDHPVVRHGLRSLLSQYPDIELVGEAEGGPAALELVESHRPDVVLMDVRLVGPNGLALAQRIQRSPSEVRVIILTSYDDQSYLLRAAQAGVHGYLLKSASDDVLVDTIRAVHRGERRISPELIDQVLEQLVALSRTQLQSESGLSEQEFYILQLMAQGASTGDMVRELYLSERTIKRKVQDILSKLGATNRAQAVAEAYERGLL